MKYIHAIVYFIITIFSFKVSALLPIQRIAHGYNATLRQFPHHAALVRFGENNHKFFCGGSLITKKHILTAGHCVINSDINECAEPKKIGFSLGSIVFSTDVQRNTTKWIVHQVYRKWACGIGSFHADVAIIILEAPIRFSIAITSIRLPSPRDKESQLIGLTGLIPGFGYNESDQFPSQLLVANVTVVPRSDCQTLGPETVIDDHICVKPIQKMMDCQGDSGGGLVINRTVYGIVSYGEHCVGAKFSAYTSVLQYLNWIKVTANLKK